MGKKAKSFMDAGALVPDEVIIGILKERLAQADCANGFILDGVPRTIAQAEAIETMGIRIDKVLELQVEDNVIVDRMSGRRVCEKCGASYHIVNKKSKVEGVCDLCGGKTVIRKDDQPATVLDRLKAYHEQTEPLVEFYRTRGKLAEIKFCPLEGPRPDKFQFAVQHQTAEKPLHSKNGCRGFFVYFKIISPFSSASTTRVPPDASVPSIRRSAAGSSTALRMVRRRSRAPKRPP